MMTPVEGGGERRRMYGLAWALTTDWPNGFVGICREAGVTRSVVIKDMPFVPFVLDEMLKVHLDDEPYHASEYEVAAVAAWLRRTKGAATSRNLMDHCGESRTAIYRHMDMSGSEDAFGLAGRSDGVLKRYRWTSIGPPCRST